MCIKCPLIDPETPPAGDQRGKRASPVTRSRTDLTFLCYIEEMETTKTAWEYYNESK